jgi:hypothetical protein
MSSLRCGDKKQVDFEDVTTTRLGALCIRRCRIYHGSHHWCAVVAQACYLASFLPFAARPWLRPTFQANLAYG